MVLVNVEEVVVACYKHVFRVVWKASGKTTSPSPPTRLGSQHHPRALPRL